MGLEKNSPKKPGLLSRGANLLAAAMLFGSANLAQAESKNTDSVKSPTEITATTTASEEEHENKLEINEKEWEELFKIHESKGNQQEQVGYLQKVAQTHNLTEDESRTLINNALSRLLEYQVDDLRYQEKILEDKEKEIQWIKEMIEYSKSQQK